MPQSISDLKVFNEYTYSSMTETLRQQIELFNEATRGCITLRSAAHQGDYSELAFFKKISGLVRRRNAYADGSESDIASKKLEHLLDVSVKVAAGTPPVAIPPSQYKWIQMNPEVAGAAMGQQLAIDAMADMLNSALLAGGVALGAQAAVVNDVSGASTTTATFEGLRAAAAKFGDRQSDVTCWVLHSHVMNSLWSEALANSQRLFTYGTISVLSDPFGRVFVMTDSPSLYYTDGDVHYRTLGLVPGALYVGQNNDYTDNWETSNGKENIQRTYQAEWTYNLGVKGFTWDKANGGASPTDVELGTATNWDKLVTDNKDLAGVLLISL